MKRAFPSSLRLLGATVLLLAISGCILRAERSLVLAWDASPDADVKHYRIYYNLVGGHTTFQMTVGKATTATIPNVTVGEAYTFFVTAVNAAGRESAPCIITYTVPALIVNRSPTLQSVPDQEIKAGHSLSLTLNATDPDLPGQTLTYRLVSGPDDAAVDPKTGAFTWRPPKSHATSARRVTVSVSDSGLPSRSDTRSFKVLVRGLSSPAYQPVPNTAELEVVRWVAELGNSRAIAYACPMPSESKNIGTSRYLEVSDDLKTWITVGEFLGGNNDLRDSAGRQTPMRFYRIRSEPTAQPSDSEREPE
jgi:hypothetical protein